MTRTVGVEEEFLLARRGSPYLAPVGDAVAAAADATGGQFEHELKKPQAELGTRPHESGAELGQELRARRRQLAAAARDEGAVLLATATAPMPAVAAITDEPRYQQMREIFGEIAELQLTCGMHVHVSVESPDEGVAVINGLRPWLPVLLALSVNSPFWNGHDTAYASFRSVLWGQWPTAGATQPFTDRDDYERVRRQLIDSGAATDDGMIYFDARLSARYPTVEMRVADVCLDIEDATAIALLARALVDTIAAAAPGSVPRAELVRAAAWRAARYGVSGELLDLRAEPRLAPAEQLIKELLDLVAPALGPDADAVRDAVGVILRRGTGASRQRAAFARRQSVADVLELVSQQP